VALDLSSSTPNSTGWAMDRPTINQVVTVVTLPTWVRSVTLQPITNSLRVAPSGTDGAALGSDYITITGNTSRALSVAGQGRRAAPKLYLSASADGTVVELLLSDLV